MTKGLSYILAVSLTVSVFVSMNVNAIDYPGISDTSEKYSEFMENFTEVTEYPYITDYYDTDNGSVRYFVSNISNSKILKLEDCGIIFDFTVPKNSDIGSINKVLKSIEDSYKIGSYATGTKDEPKIKYSIVDTESNGETKKIAMELCNELKSICDLQTFDYYGHIFKPSFSNFYSSEIMCYPYSETNHPEIPDVLREYVEGNLDKFEVADEGSESNKWCTVKAKETVTLEERFTAAAKIAGELGLHMVRIAPGLDENYSVETIDMCNNLSGDANCDGEYTIADSTAILQFLGNPDKYSLSLQGKFNADIYNVGDGITPSDALEIQKAMANKD